MISAESEELLLEVREEMARQAEQDRLVVEARLEEQRRIQAPLA
ncbi:MAG: hypothetical protein AAGC74_03815 [Verrucomicrobiota bacterium]